MAKKKLQLSEIKVNSFVTQVTEAEQKTAKGGYVYRETAPAIILSIGQDRLTWTELKTRASGNNGETIKTAPGRR